MDEVDAVIVRNLKQVPMMKMSCLAKYLLRRFDARKKAMAKLRIQTVLMDVEFLEPF